MKALRTDIPSTLSFVDEMFAAGFEVVLFGRWNQDPVDVS